MPSTPSPSSSRWDWPAGCPSSWWADALFRRTLDIGRIDIRLAAAILALASIPLGTQIAAFAQLAALVLLTVAALSAEGPAAGRSTSRGTAEDTRRRRFPAVRGDRTSGGAR